MANKEISLNWNGYQNNILSKVKELFKDEGLCDVTLVSDGQCFKAHRVILSANSSVFRTIFQQNPHKDPIIVLHDINTASLRTLLTFMYNGEVNVTEEFLPVLLKTAETLRVCGLSSETEASTQDEITPAQETQPVMNLKGSEPGDNTNKSKRVDPHPQPDVPVTSETCDTFNNDTLIPKVEPIDSPLTEDANENSNDTETDIAMLDEAQNKNPASPVNIALTDQLNRELASAWEPEPNLADTPYSSLEVKIMTKEEQEAWAMLVKKEETEGNGEGENGPVYRKRRLKRGKNHKANKRQRKRLEKQMLEESINNKADVR